MIGKYETLVEPNFSTRLARETENIILKKNEKILQYDSRSSKTAKSPEIDIEYMNPQTFFTSLKQLFCLIFREELAKYIQHNLNEVNFESFAAAKKDFQDYFKNSTNRGHCLNAFVDKSFFSNFGSFIQEIKQNIDFFYDNEDKIFGSIENKDLQVTRLTSNTLETCYNFEPIEREINELLQVFVNYNQKKVKIIIREVEDVEQMPEEYPANKNDEAFAMDIFFSVHLDKKIKFGFFSQQKEDNESEENKSYYVTQFMNVFPQRQNFYFNLKQKTTQKKIKCLFGKKNPIILKDEYFFDTSASLTAEAKEVVFEKEDLDDKILLKIKLVEENLVCSLLFTRKGQVESLF